MIDLSTKSGRASYNVLREVDKKKLREQALFSRFLKTGEESPFSMGNNHQVYTTSDHQDHNCIVLHDSGIILNNDSSINYFNQDNTDDIIGVVVVKSNKKNQIYDVVLDGDEQHGYNPLLDYNLGGVTVSFECLRLITESKDTTEVCKLLNDGWLSIVDFAPDKKIKLKPSEMTKVKSYNNGEGPLPSAPVGFTLANGYWHRSATVVLKNEKTHEFYIIGQDEGTYFGCLLPRTTYVETVKQAYEALMPEEIRGIKNVQRQGEWFVVPVKEKELPTLQERICTVNGDIDLPVEDKRSNIHSIICNSNSFVTRNGVYAKNMNLVHNQHKTIEAKGWVRFVKNMAVRSVSVEGVD